MNKHFSSKELRNCKKYYVVYTVVLVDIAGSPIAALVFSHLLFLSRLTSNPEGWIWKSYREWYKETRLTEDQVRRAVRLLIAKGLIETKIMKAYGKPTLHYRIIAPREICEAVFLQDRAPSLCVSRIKKTDNVCSSAAESLLQRETLKDDVVGRLMQCVHAGQKNNNVKKLINKYVAKGEAYVRRQIKYANKRSTEKHGYEGYLANSLEYGYAPESNTENAPSVQLPLDGVILKYQGKEVEVQAGTIRDLAGRIVSPSHLLHLIANGEARLMGTEDVN